MLQRREVVALIPAAGCSDQRRRAQTDASQPERGTNTQENSRAGKQTGIQILENRSSGTVCHLI
jgi:hypothetical protein